MALDSPPGNISDLLAKAREVAAHINRQRDAMKQVAAEVAATPKPEPGREVTR